MAIETIYDTLAAQGGTVRLDDASLGTIGLDALLAATGLPAAIAVVLPGALPQPDGDTLVFSGTSGFLAGTVQSWGGSSGFLDGAAFGVTVTIITSGSDEASLEVTVALPAGWVLGDSFYGFSGTTFTTDALRYPGLVFGYNGGGVSDGLILSAEIFATGPLTPLPLLADMPSPAPISGPVVLSEWGPAFTLSGALGTIRLMFDPLPLTNASYRLTLGYEQSSYTDTTDTAYLPSIGNDFVADCGAINDTTLVMTVTLSRTNVVTLSFSGAAGSNPVANQDVLIPLFPNSAGFPGSLTSSLFAGMVPGIILFGATGDPSTGAMSSTFGSLGLIEPWIPIPAFPDFQVVSLEMTWSYVYGPPSSLSGSIGATLDLGGYYFDLDIEYPSLSFAGTLQNTVTLSFAEVNSAMLSVLDVQAPANADVGTLTFSGFGIAVDLDADTLSFQATADIQLTLAGLAISLSATTLNLDYGWSANAAVFTVDGVFAVNSWQFSLSALLESAGMRFSGQLLQAQTVVVSDVVGQLLGPVVTPDQFSLALTVEAFSLTIDTITDAMAVSGAVGWSLTVCGQTMGGDFTIDVSSPDSGSSWAGTIGGGITIADIAFGMDYSWGPSLGLLKGSFSAGQTYDWTAFVDAFGATQVPLPAPIPTAPDLDPITVGFDYDFESDVFTLTGVAAGGDASMAGFFSAVPALYTGTGKTGFAAGIQVELTPGFFAGMNSALAPFDDFGLSSVIAFTVANFTNPSFLLPIATQSYFPGVCAGMTFSAAFSWPECPDDLTRTSVSLMTGSVSAISVMIGFYDIAGGWKFQFAGTMSDIALNLGAGIDIESVSLALAMTETGIDVDYQVLFSILVSIDPGSGWVDSGDGTKSDQLLFDGQLEFEATSAGGVGGFAAIFMSGTWHEPFGIPDLSVADLGLLLGVAEQGGEPVPSFGLTGFLAYPPAGVEAFVAIYFDGANPDDSLFIGSMSEVAFLQFAEMMAWAAAGVEVPSLLQSVLETYGVYPIPFDLSTATTTLTDADFAQLNDYVVPNAFFALVAELGQPMQKPAAGALYQTLTVILGDADNPDVNTEWFIADFQSGQIFHLVRTGTGSPPYTLAMDPWLYVVPNTVTLGLVTYQQGYGFGGRLKLPGLELDIVAELAPTLGLKVDADAPEPILYPAAIGNTPVPPLLVITAATDDTLGPRVSLYTYQVGDIPPHFYLDAAVSLLNMAKISTEISILSSGLSFYLELSTALDVLDARMTCLVANEGFSANFDLSLDLDVDTDPVKVAGVTVIPSIHLNTGFGLSLAVSFPLTSGDSNVQAAFKGKISFNWGDQSFSAGIDFKLSDLADLTTVIADWVVKNAGALFENLLNDFIQWARAMINGLFSFAAAAAASALKALGAAYDAAAQLMAEIGYTLDEVYDAIKAVFAVAEELLINALTKAFHIQFSYAALSQQVGPATTATAPSTLLDWTENTAAPAVAAGEWLSIMQPDSGVSGVFAASLFDTISLDIALADPGLYALSFKGFGLSATMPYQRVSDSLGVFSLEMPSSAELLTIGFGPFGFRNPALTIAIYTDGTYLFDYGYPDDGDWSRSAALVTPIFSGQGGFQFTSLGNSSLPAGWSPVTLALGVAAAMRIALDGSLDLGMLSGGWSLTYEGGFTAIAGYGAGLSPTGSAVIDPSQPAEFQGTLTLSFSGALYGSVDFGIVSAAVHVDLSGTMGCGLTVGSSVALSLNVLVSVGVKVRIKLGLFKITISFKFSMHVDVGPATLPWPSTAMPSSAVTSPLEPIAWAGTPSSRLLSSRTMAATAAGASLPALGLWFIPELTITYDGKGSGTPAMLFNLAIPYTEADPGCMFNLLVQSLLQWALSLDGEAGETTAVSRDRLERLTRRLKTKPRQSRLYADADDPDTLLTYDLLVQFLQDWFSAVTVTVPVSDASAVAFPMIPDLVAWGGVEGGTSSSLCDFAQYNRQPTSYEDAIAATFATFKLFAAPETTAPLAMAEDDGTASLATYAFLAYFEYLLQGGAGEALDLTGAAGLDQIGAADWAALAFDQTASGITVSFRGGVQLPANGEAGQDMAPLYQLTGQQMTLATIATPPTAISLSLARGSGGGWITLDPQPVAGFSQQAVSDILGLTVSAQLTRVTQTALTAILATYPFGSFTAYAPTDGKSATLAAIPPALAAAPGAVTLATGVPGQSGTLDGDVQWASLLTLTLRQVVAAGGGIDQTVYTLTAVDSSQVGVIAQLIVASAAGTALTLTLLVPTGDGGYAACAAAADATTLLRTNLSTESQPQLDTAARSQTEEASATGGTDPVAAALTDAANALAILLALGETNAAGYYLALDEADSGLAGLFTTSNTATAALLVARGSAVNGTATTSSAATDNVLLVDQIAASDLTSLGLFATSTSLVGYQPAYPPGVLPVTVTRPNPETADSDEDQSWLDQLYGLFTVAISGSAYADLGYAPACSPADDGAETWTYFLSLPLTNLLAGGPSDNPYAAIGTTPTVTTQIRDCFGNPVTTNLTAFAVPQTYNDVLVGPGAWVGSTLNWTPTTKAGTLTVTLAVDKATLDNNLDTAQPLYAQAAWQLAETGDIEFRLSSSLDTGGAQPLAAAGQQAITAYVAAVLDYLDGASTTLPAAVELTYGIASPVAALPPVAVDVALILARVAHVDASTAALLPQVASIATPATADLSAGLTTFATIFQTAFPNLCLATGSGSGSNQLWAVAAGLLQPAISGTPTYFAPAPFYTSLQSGTTPVPQYGAFTTSSWTSADQSYAAVDCDQLFQSICGTIDLLLGGSYAAAAFRANPDGYRTLVEGRAAIAQLYSDNQLSWLFTEQAGAADDPTLWGSRESFSSNLQNALANAYVLDGVLAFDADWAKLPAGATATGLTLWGEVGPGNGSTALVTTTASLTLDDSASPATTLYYDFRPGELSADASLSVPLSYRVTHVALTDTGNGVSIWLALALPATVSIGTGDVEVPLIDRFFPTAPTLQTQSADATTVADADFSQLFQWRYSAGMLLEPVAQDTTTLTIRYNRQSADQAALKAMAAVTPVLTAAQALMRFQAGYAEIEPVLPDLLAADVNAANIVAALADLVLAIQINSDWAGSGATAPILAAAIPTASTELSLSLAAEEEDGKVTGRWILTVATTGDGTLPGTLSALPLTADGTAQPATTVLGIEPLQIAYIPEDDAASVLVQVTLDGLDLRLYQNAVTEAYVTRNASLLTGYTTEGSYVFVTATVAFPQPVAPYITGTGTGTGYNLAEVVATPVNATLANWLAALLSEVAGSAAHPRLALTLGYRFSQYTGTDAEGSIETIQAFQPVTLSRTVLLDTGSGGEVTVATFAQALADAFIGWQDSHPLDLHTGQLVVTLSLYSAQGSIGPALLQAPNLWLALAAIENETR
ncbi:hypothetical protein [Azospirillum lipoferum]|uniref:Uncharacterized protein n=1 Tax=Azospirillum lipoferum (strain 4B) TaxID=862719 RepID=G7ZE31_AZOL4|nr:hypothetical protein [Azospirillum lipoferum]CBS89290.1 conserved protein of unknown function [Azospirillum lipoferum 4B]